MKRPKISFFVHDLAGNPIVRAAPLAQALSSQFEIEIIGFLHSGSQVYGPYQKDFTYKTIRCSPFFPVPFLSLHRLASLAEGDIIYACKPLPTTLIPALLAARRRGNQPVILDVEDDEWAFGSRFALNSWTCWRERIASLALAESPLYARLIHPLVRRVDACTVVSERLHQRYGGEVIRHGPNEQLFNPDAIHVSPQQCRERFSLPTDAPLALFAGMARFHKGLDILVDALQHDVARQWNLILAGPPEQRAFQEAASVLGPRCKLVGLVPQNELPLLLHAVDAIPVPQRRSAVTDSQVPAKLLEGMAMRKAVIASEVGDLPTILGEGTRGWLVPPDMPNALAHALHHIHGDPAEADQRRQLAHKWYQEHASPHAIQVKLAKVLNSLDYAPSAPCRS